MKTLADLENLIETYNDSVLSNVKKCGFLIKNKGLKEALDYCNKQGIDPPQCSLTAKSKNADKMRTIATRLLSDKKWWSKRLTKKALQDFELEQLKAGLVTNYISDVSWEYHKKHKK